MQLFLSHKHLEVIVGLLIGLLLILVCLKDYAGLRRERGEGIRAHTAFIKLAVLYGHGL